MYYFTEYTKLGRPDVVSGNDLCKECAGKAKK
jgi:hypothetical protein